MYELLNPQRQLNLIGFKKAFNDQFVGMTDDASVTYEELIAIRHQLLQEIHNSLTNDERKFLLSIKLGTPDWSLMPIPNLESFPSIKWKLANIGRIPPNKKQSTRDNLRKLLKI